MKLVHPPHIVPAQGAKDQGELVKTPPRLVGPITQVLAG